MDDRGFYNDLPIRFDGVPAEAQVQYVDRDASNEACLALRSAASFCIGCNLCFTESYQAKNCVKFHRTNLFGPTVELGVAHEGSLCRESDREKTEDAIPWLGLE